MKRKLPPHIVLPDGRWRFVKKGRTVKNTRRNVSMARYGRTRTIYRKARKGYRSRKGLLGGSMGNVVWGAAAGAISPMIPQFLGRWTLPVVFGAGGYLLKKPALLTVAGYEAGQAIMGGGIANIFGGGSSTGGGWL